MATAEKTKLGRITCPVCGDVMHLRLATQTQTLSFACGECDVSGFAKKGTKASKLLVAKLPAPEPEAKPNAEANPTPTNKQQANKPGFKLEF